MLNSNPSAKPTVVVSVSPDVVILNYKGQTRFFNKATPEYDRVKTLLKTVPKEQHQEELLRLFEELKVQKKENKSVNPEYRETSEGVYIKRSNGTERLLPKTLGKRLMEFVNEGLPYESILLCADRAFNNPSYNVVQRFFDCMEYNHHPLLPDGRFLAWRKVRKNAEGNLVDIYTGKVDNSVGATPRMERNEVDEDQDRTCSNGYHASSWNYARHHYGNSNDVMIEVAVDPADLVAIPRDYNNQKFRICGYEVLAICEEEDTSNLSRHSSDFAVDPNDVDTCYECGEHCDFCECFDNDNEGWDDEDLGTCEDCDMPLEDCICECCPNCGNGLDDPCDCDIACNECGWNICECEDRDPADR